MSVVFTEQDIIYLDLETRWGTEYSLTKLSMEEYVRDPRFEIYMLGYQCINRPDVSGLIVGHDAVGKFLRDSHATRATWVAHNMQFDGFCLAHAHDLIARRYSCTKFLSYIINNNTEKSHSLGALGESMLGQGKLSFLAHTKDIQSYESLPSTKRREVESYCMKDVELGVRIFEILDDCMNPLERELIDWTIQAFVNPQLELDEDLLREYLAELNIEIQDAVENSGLTKEQLRKNQPVIDALEAEGVVVPMKASPRTGLTIPALARTDADFIGLLDHPRAKVRSLVIARLGVKSNLNIKRTARFLDIAQRGKLPICLNYYGAMQTGRFSGGDRINPQNLPRGGTLRDAIVAPDGMLIAAGDSSNIESRVVDFWAGEQESINAYRSGHDIYIQTYSATTGVPFDKVTKEQRQVGKILKLALAYGMGAGTLLKTLGHWGVSMDANVAAGLHRRWRKAHRKNGDLRELCHTALVNAVKGQMTSLSAELGIVMMPGASVMLPSGLVIHYPNLRWEQGDLVYDQRGVPTKIYGGKVVENITQSLARSILSEQLLAARAIGLNPVHFVHDEIVCLVPERKGALAVKILEDILRTPPSWWPDIVLDGEAGVGRTYGAAK